MDRKDREETAARLMLLASMFIFGTIGIFRRYIPLPSGMIAFARGVIGMLFLLVVIRLKGSRISVSSIKENLPVLVLSGALLGFNWILLFEAYQYTSVATATLCYYLAPIFVVLASAVLLKEKMTPGKWCCMAAALAGMILVSGVTRTGISELSELRGIGFGVAAAVFYAGIILLNKRLKKISAYDRTLVQLAVSAAVLLPYTLLAEGWRGLEFTPLTILMLLIIGVAHTGIAYALYFGSMSGLKAQTIALYSYLDPIVAVILSAVLLHEEMGASGITGAVLVLGAAVLSERE